MARSWYLWSFAWLGLSQSVIAENPVGGLPAPIVHSSSREVVLSPRALDAMSPEVTPLRLQTVSRMIEAPGEVEVNSYRTSIIASRISAQIIERHAHLGQHVETGRAIVTLSSVQMAEAQGELQAAEREWKRVHDLGRKLVGDQRYSKAEIAWRQAQSKVRAYGMTEAQVKQFLRNPDSIAIGDFTLLAPRDGVITQDHFLDGALVAPGEVLTMIVDESVVRIEANLFPEDALDIVIGMAVDIYLSGAWVRGKVVQKHHILDPTTRTMPVRIELSGDLAHKLHPGQFVRVRFPLEASRQLAVVPVRAIVHDVNGSPVVFLRVGQGRFRAIPVQLGAIYDDLRVISGIELGSDVVTAGAFFLNALMQRDSANVHAH